MNALRYITGRALMDLVSKVMTVPFMAFLFYSIGSWYYGSCGGFWSCAIKFIVGYALFILIFAFFVRPVFARFTHRFARELVVAAQEHWYANDDRQPVLYLRPFDIDKDADGQLDYHRGAYKSGFSIEECLVTAFRRTGPVVGLVDPFNTIRQVGVVRVFVEEHGDWLTMVRRMADEAKYVILVLDNRSPNATGLGEEIKLIKEQIAPEKVVVYRPVSMVARDSFAEAFSVEDEGRGLGPQLVVFDGEWKPSYLPFRAVRGPYSMFFDPAINLRRVLNRALAGREFKSTWTPSALEYISLFIHLALTVLGWVAYYQAFLSGRNI